MVCTLGQKWHNSETLEVWEQQEWEEEQRDREREIEREGAETENM